MAHTSWRAIDPEMLLFFTLRSGAYPEAGGYNRGYYPNREVDALLNGAWEERDRGERGRVYRTVQAIVREDAPWVFVATRRHNMVSVRNAQQRAQLHPTGLVDLREARFE